ncbi:MAG: hypothetical protein U1F98_10645 [Verrucomicrobiota bacterium]
MNKLSNQKRNQLILVVLANLAVIAGLWWFLIRTQQESLQALDAKRATDQAKVSEIRESIKNSKQIEEDLLVVSNLLDVQEQEMASGDLYASMVNSIKKFKAGYKLEIPQFNTSGSLVEATLLPKFPYKQFTVTIQGVARYAELGRFIADFENEFPSSRLINLELTPASATSPEDKDKLAFKVDVVSLVRPAATRTASNP